ncbi:MAG TPA: LON peptidase substrate-binding domain-containing protein [Gemmataceae bacterium]|nr:LON peptidase substrate-binding domain-containing protein [Gemmataceae bacterium]
MSDELSPLTDFAGTARLFPLPNLVLFPHVMQPLHIFEPRYRQMTADALDSDRLITLALLRPGWEADYDGKPAIHPIACLGRIVAEQRLDDGRFNILLRGLSRLRILEEIPTGKLYRSARVELLRDCGAPSGKDERRLRRRLSTAVVEWFPSQGAVLEQFRKLLKSELQLGPLADIIAFALPIELAVKQELLEELDVGHRLRRLLKYMDAHPQTAAPAATERKFPPEFSVN